MFLLPREGAGVREYEVLLDQAELQGEKCLTAHSDFKDNMLSESVLKIDVCQYLEENYPMMKIWKECTNYTDLSHIVDVLAGFSRIWGKRIEDLFPLVFTRKLGSASRPLMAFIHILNMPRD